MDGAGVCPGVDCAWLGDGLADPEGLAVPEGLIVRDGLIVRVGLAVRDGRGEAGAGGTAGYVVAGAVVAGDGFPYCCTVAAGTGRTRM